MLRTRSVLQQWNLLDTAAKYENATKTFSLLSKGAINNLTGLCVHDKKHLCLSRRQNAQHIIRTQSGTKSFSHLLRESSFIGIGDYVGRHCYGTVVEVADSSLFVDYGGKFLCVCKVPRKSNKLKWVGTHVEIKILMWELSAKFIGATKDITLLESEGIITKVY